ncbi:transcriptional repressor [bacterium]|nr:transcriptional repressor [bacterium]
MTRQRRVILEELKKAGSHPTADEVYRRVQKRIPNISMGTVYRNLEALSEHGIICRLQMSEGPMRFDASMEKHYHVRCSKCGRVGDVPASLVNNFESKVRAECEWQITGHRLEFIGICPRCQSKK